MSGTYILCRVSYLIDQPTDGVAAGSDADLRAVTDGRLLVELSQAFSVVGDGVGWSPTECTEGSVPGVASMFDAKHDANSSDGPVWRALIPSTVAWYLHERGVGVGGDRTKFHGSSIPGT